jgi:hypothetical protein
MLKSLKFKGAALAVSVALLGGTAWLAAGATGAYFSDTHTGAISGTVGSIRVTPYGGAGSDGTDLAFTNMLPGVPQTVTVKYQNTGANTEDVYIVFDNATALSALNSLGRYGEAHLSANGNALFDSANLNDRLATCVVFAPGGSPTNCWPMKAQYLAASNVAPGATGSVSFTFDYSGKTTTQGPWAWNVYPQPDGQVTVNAADGAGSGLPYEIVATQHGVTPGQ